MAKSQRTWLQRLIHERRSSHRTPHPSHVAQRTPWWVATLTDGGRPIVAVIVLIMCAPGEHHLARLAGWNETLAWGMPSVLAAYAGIAAAVASKRPKEAPGKKSAVLGAWLALAAAMTAQGLSHAIVTSHLPTQPLVPLWLVLATSAVPPLVFGHLLHLAATPVARAAEQPQAAPETAARAAATAVPAWPGSAPAGARLLPLVPPAAEQPLEQLGEQVDPDPSNREQAGLLTTREVARRFGVKSSTVGTWKERGKISPAHTDPRLGNLYDPETLPALASLA
ncbi:helix-turn-helix transcriptional regulator [Streptomyces sp. NPDC005708]|uniref:helix-turn-helix transcriptional regulator n=1 Tax=Streptomyces sp. NPDC005708 TaxID=3154564 RepID=UPI0033EDC078